MKLKLIQKDPGLRVGFTIRTSTNRMLDAYIAEYAKASGGEAPTPGEVVDFILREYMETDKVFMAAYKNAG